MKRERQINSAPGGSQRQLRVGEIVRHAVADILSQGSVHDPDLEGHIITVPEVRMSPDLKLATIYVMPLGGRDMEIVIAALERNKKFVRGEVARRVNLKFAPDIAGPGDPALGIVGIALLAPAHRKAIALAPVHHERNGFGGLAQGDRQPAGGERIKRAGVACAFGLEQPLHDGDRMGRGHADRFVEHDPAMDVALVAARLAILARLFAGARIVVGPPRIIAAQF